MIELTPLELEVAAWLGSRRQVSSLVRGLEDKHGFEGDGWGAHIEGVCGEMAAAKAANLYYEPRVDTFKGVADIGDDIEVRTRSRHDYELLVRPADRDIAQRAFVHVTGRAPRFEVHGWLRGLDAMRPQWQQTHGGREPAWFVPASELLPMFMLMRRVKT